MRSGGFDSIGSLIDRTGSESFSAVFGAENNRVVSVLGSVDAGIPVLLRMPANCVQRGSN